MARRKKLFSDQEINKVVAVYGDGSSVAVDAGRSGKIANAKVRRLSANPDVEKIVTHYDDGVSVSVARDHSDEGVRLYEEYMTKGTPKQQEEIARVIKVAQEVEKAELDFAKADVEKVKKIVEEYNL